MGGVDEERDRCLGITGVLEKDEGDIGKGDGERVMEIGKGLMGEGADRRGGGTKTPVVLSKPACRCVKIEK